MESNKIKNQERIVSLLIKARESSGATKAERESSKNMAFRLMERHSITKEDILKSTEDRKKKDTSQVPVKEWFIKVDGFARSHPRYSEFKHHMTGYSFIEFDEANSRFIVYSLSIGRYINQVVYNYSQYMMLVYAEERRQEDKVKRNKKKQRIFVNVLLAIGVIFVMLAHLIG